MAEDVAAAVAEEHCRAGGRAVSGIPTQRDLGPVRSDGVVPELVLVARPGVRPPATLGEGQVLARLAPSAERTTRTMEIRLEAPKL